MVSPKERKVILNMNLATYVKQMCHKLSLLMSKTNGFLRISVTFINVNEGESFLGVQRKMTS